MGKKGKQRARDSEVDVDYENGPPPALGLGGLWGDNGAVDVNDNWDQQGSYGGGGAVNGWDAYQQQQQEDHDQVSNATGFGNSPNPGGAPVPGAWKRTSSSMPHHAQAGKAKKSKNNNQGQQWGEGGNWQGMPITGANPATWGVGADMYGQQAGQQQHDNGAWRDGSFTPAQNAAVLENWGLDGGTGMTFAQPEQTHGHGQSKKAKGAGAVGGFDPNSLAKQLQQMQQVHQGKKGGAVDPMTAWAGQPTAGAAGWAAQPATAGGGWGAAPGAGGGWGAQTAAGGWGAPDPAHQQQAPGWGQPVVDPYNPQAAGGKSKKKKNKDRHAQTQDVHAADGWGAVNGHAAAQEWGVGGGAAAQAWDGQTAAGGWGAAPQDGGQAWAAPAAGAGGQWDANGGGWGAAPGAGGDAWGQGGGGGKGGKGRGSWAGGGGGKGGDAWGAPAGGNGGADWNGAGGAQDQWGGGGGWAANGGNHQAGQGSPAQAQGWGGHSGHHGQTWEDGGEEEEEEEEDYEDDQGDGWNHAGGEGGWESGHDEWGQSNADTNTNSWGHSWRQQPQERQGRGRTPKVKVTSPSSDGWTVVSPHDGRNKSLPPSPRQPERHSSILKTIKNRLKGHSGHPDADPRNQWDQKKVKKDKHLKRHRRHVSMQPSLWPTEEVDEEDEEEDYHDEWRDAEANHVWANPPAMHATMPSKSFALASDGRPPMSRFGSMGNPQGDMHFVDSNGAALIPAETALYSPDRLARNRIHWLFSPDKDERVYSLLDWIQKMAYGLSVHALHKFIQTRERGALITNADFRPAHSPNEPAFDWISYDDAQRTFDRTLQESLAFYDPSTQVLVFVFLLSKSGRSMAIWRRKLPIPNNMRLALGPSIDQAKAALRKEYPIHLDEWPPPDPVQNAAQADAGKPKRSGLAKVWASWFSGK